MFEKTQLTKKELTLSSGEKVAVEVYQGIAKERVFEKDGEKVTRYFEVPGNAIVCDKEGKPVVTETGLMMEGSRKEYDTFVASEMKAPYSFNVVYTFKPVNALITYIIRDGVTTPRIWTIREGADVAALAAHEVEFWTRKLENPEAASKSKKAAPVSDEVKNDQIVADAVEAAE